MVLLVTYFLSRNAVWPEAKFAALGAFIFLRFVWGTATCLLL